MCSPTHTQIHQQRVGVIRAQGVWRQPLHKSLADEAMPRLNELSRGISSQTLQGDRCHSLSPWKLKRKKKCLGGRRRETKVPTMYYFISPVLNKQTKNETCEEKCDPYSGKQSIKQNRSNQHKRKQSIDNDSPWVQLLDISDKSFKAAILNTFEKLKLCSRN